MSCAQKANLNFGIISSCAYISIVINCGVGYVWFREVITLKMLFGIVVTLTGIIGISLAKGEGAVVVEDTATDVSYYQTLAVVFSIMIGVMNALQTVQTKFMVSGQTKYEILDIQSDAGILFGIICAVITLYHIASIISPSLHSMHSLASLSVV